jgi:transposase
MEDHGLCIQCRSAPLATITSMDVKINPSGFIGFMQNCQSSSPLLGHAIHQWLFNNGVDEVKIPTYSPDLNPMENMFSILKHNIEARNPKNIETLQEIAKDEWGKISQTLCRELASSMPHRVRCILACDGRRTSY